MAIEQAKAETEISLRQVLIQEIKKMALKVQRVPKLADLGSSRRFYVAFGSWNNALRAAGFPVARKTTLRLETRRMQGQKYEATENECLDALKRLSAVLGGYRPTVADLDSDLAAEVGCPTRNTIIRRFGSMVNALRSAGLVGLQTRHENVVTIEKARIAKVFKGKSFVMAGDLPKKNISKIARREGLRVVRASKSYEVNIVLDWMRGQAYDGALPDREGMRLAMGNDAYQYLVQYCQGRSMAKIGKDTGLTRERVRQVLTERAKALVRAILEKGGDTHGLETTKR